jgi:predicted NAD/FAD-dependent oxidoreductase
MPAEVSLLAQLVDSTGRVIVGADGVPAHPLHMGYARGGDWAQGARGECAFNSGRAIAQAIIDRRCKP